MKLTRGFLIIALVNLGCGIGAHMPVSSSDLETGGNIDYKKDLLPIFTSRCSSCHNASSSPPKGNWLDFNTASSKKNAIYQHIWVSRDMPPNGDISEHERSLIASW